VFGHNEHEIDAARRMAAGLGMLFRPKISWDDDFSPIRDPKLVQIQTGLHPTREAHYKATGSSYLRSICCQLWNAPVLNWDGRLMGCCRNFRDDFGVNAFDQGLAAAVASPRIENARRSLMGRGEMNPVTPCATCDLYLTMKRDGNWISQREIAESAPRSAVLVSVVIDPGDSPATHTDVFVAPGDTVNPVFLASLPKAQRFQIGETFSVCFWLNPGKHMLYVLPRQLDPTFRKQYPPLPPVTRSLEIPKRPVAQEFLVPLVP